jgi:hypothetical protein
MTPPRRLKAFKGTACSTRIPTTWKVLLGQSILLLGEKPGNLMASLKEKKRDCGIARDGGLHHAEQFLGLRDIKDFNPSSDIVFISIDLEVSRQEISKPGAPLVKEFGIATLDTRHLRCPTSLYVATKTISTLQFSTSHASHDFLGCDFTDFSRMRIRSNGFRIIDGSLCYYYQILTYPR